MPSCYAVKAEKVLIQAALRARFSRGKGFIPKPSKSCRKIGTTPLRDCPISTGKVSTRSAPPYGSLKKLDISQGGRGATKRAKWRQSSTPSTSSRSPRHWKTRCWKIQHRISRYWKIRQRKTRRRIIQRK